MEDKIKTNIIINEAGAQQVLMTIALFKKIVMLYLIWVVLSGINTVVSYIPYFRQPYHLWVNVFNYRIVPVLHFVLIILGSASYFFQYKAYNMQKKGLNTGDSELYVSSYKLFRKGMTLLLIGATLEIMSLIIFIYNHFNISN